MNNFSYKSITSEADWDGYIKNSGFAATFFQSWNWGEFQQNLKNKVHYLGFYDNDQQFAAALCVVVRAKRGSYLYVRNGPVAAWTNKQEAEFIITTLKELAEREGLWFIRISPLLELNSESASLLNSYKFPTSPMYDVDALDTWILDIDKDEATLLAGMRKSTRYEIKKAERDGVEIETSQDVNDLVKFFPIYLDTITRQQWTGYSDEYLKQQFSTFVKDDQAKLYLAKYQGKYIAASIFIYYGDTSYYHYSGSLTDYRKIPGPSLIQWHNIQEAKQRGLKKYNFWGIAPPEKPNHPWQGLSFFKMGFGGYAKRYNQTADIPVSKKYWLTNLFETIQKKRKGY